MNHNDNKQAYDRSVAAFSPDGRIYQVEYARKAVENGSPTIGIQTDVGVVLAANVKRKSDLSVGYEKLHRVSDKMAALTTGYVPDGRNLVDNLRVALEKDNLRYGETPDPSVVTKQIADELQKSTQRGGQRPYGASLIIGGLGSEGPKVYSIEPGGTPKQWRAVADGNRRQEYMEYLEEHYDESLSMEDAMQLAVDAFRFVKGNNEAINRKTVEMARIDAENNSFDNSGLKILNEEQIETYTGDQE